MSDGLAARSRVLTRQLIMISSSGKFNQITRLQRYKLLKNKRFSVNSRFVSRQIGPYLFDPIHDPMT